MAAGTGAGPIETSTPESVVCVVRDTIIATPDGSAPIQHLAKGDLVRTRDNGARPIRWIGSRTLPAIGALAPVVIADGALDNDRELRVGQSHRILIASRLAELMFGQPEVLVAAGHLVDGARIRVAEGGMVEYFHILFDDHEIVSANGAASESLHPCAQGVGWLDMPGREEIYDLFPRLRENPDAYGPAARTVLLPFEARALARHWARQNGAR